MAFEDWTEARDLAGHWPDLAGHGCDFGRPPAAGGVAKVELRDASLGTAARYGDNTPGLSLIGPVHQLQWLQQKRLPHLQHLQAAVQLFPAGAASALRLDVSKIEVYSS